MATRACGIVGPEFVARDLLLHKAVVGLVFVERFDDVIAVAPGVGAGLVALEAFAFGVAGEIEPVACPAFAVMRRGEQAIDNLFISFGRLVGHKGVDFFRRGRKAGQVEGDAAQQGDAVGGSGRA